MTAYIYAADLWCGKCGESTCERLDNPRGMLTDAPYDSDEYPQPAPDGGGESDSPAHCGSGLECLDPIVLPNGRKIGAWLKNELTMDGIDYVREAIADGGLVANLWADLYSDYNLEGDS